MKCNIDMKRALDVNQFKKHVALIFRSKQHHQAVQIMGQYGIMVCGSNRPILRLEDLCTAWWCWNSVY